MDGDSETESVDEYVRQLVLLLRLTEDISTQTHGVRTDGLMKYVICDVLKCRVPKKAMDSSRRLQASHAAGKAEA